MKLATIYYDKRPQVAIIENNYASPLSSFVDLPNNIGINLFYIITKSLDAIVDWYKKRESGDEEKIPFSQIHFLPPYGNPGKIWGIGLNYGDHASDLDEKTPELHPASFMKPATTIIGYKENIVLPKLSQRTTGEAELGIIIGKTCKNIAKNKWLEYVGGFTPIIDMTAEDILRKNPRYLTLSKSFDTFFSFGPEIITKDEFTNDEILNLNVSTIHNGNILATNTISNMTFQPDELVSFHSKIMTLKPGDIIATGTPGAVVLAHGDTIEARIDRFTNLINLVIDLKN